MLHHYHLLFGSLLIISSAAVEVRSMAPPADVPTSDKILKEGHNGVLDCEASGSSPPVIHWLYNDELIEQSPLDHMASGVIAPPGPVNTGLIGYEHFTISTLLISDAKLSDSGIYSCVADTPLDRTARSFNVTVESSPDDELNRRRKSLPSHPARIYHWTDQVYEGVDADTLLICRATQGFHKPLPVIRWYMDGMPILINNTDGITIHQTGDLQFSSTDEHHMALIRCEAFGDDGSVDSKEPFIYIYSSD